MAKQKELEKVGEQMDAFSDSVKEAGKEITKPVLDTSSAPPEISQRELNKSQDIYLKPKRTIQSKDKFNEAFRERYEKEKEYVRFIAENIEIRGERIEIWTRPYGGLPAELWEVPVNKPVYGPKYLAEQIKRKYYHRLIMEDRPSSAENGMQFYGSMAVDSIVHRLNAHPAPKSHQFSFHSAGNF